MQISYYLLLVPPHTNTADNSSVVDAEYVLTGR